MPSAAAKVADETHTAAAKKGRSAFVPAIGAHPCRIIFVLWDGEWSHKFRQAHLALSRKSVWCDVALSRATTGSRVRRFKSSAGGQLGAGHEFVVGCRI